MENSLSIVARCNKCGLGYVSINPKKDSFPCLVDECTGTVTRINMGIQGTQDKSKSLVANQINKTEKGPWD